MGCAGGQQQKKKVFPVEGQILVRQKARVLVKMRDSMWCCMFLPSWANPHYVSDPLPRHCGIVVALDGSEP